MTLFREQANYEDDRLMSQNNHLTEVWMSGYSIHLRWCRSEETVEKAINLENIS